MTIKKQYEIKDKVWVHINSSKLVEGTVVEYFDLGHVGKNRDIEYYVIEIPTSIEPLYEVRTWDQISQDKAGPIGAYRDFNRLDLSEENIKAMYSVGIELPINHNNDDGIEDFYEEGDPTPEEVNAALDRSVKSRLSSNYIPTATVKPEAKTARRRHFKKKSVKKQTTNDS